MLVFEEYFASDASINRRNWSLSYTSPFSPPYSAIPAYLSHFARLILQRRLSVARASTLTSHLDPDMLDDTIRVYAARQTSAAVLVFCRASPLDEHQFSTILSAERLRGL